MTASKSLITLIPWDPESPEHLQRLFEQRMQCGWHENKVKTSWRDEQRVGTKCIYWITISGNDPEQTEKMELHFSQFPTDRTSLQDTSTSIRGIPQTPTKSEFYPVGHISLDTENPELEQKGVTLELPAKDVYWIKTFYVSTALRSKRIGAAAMATAESMAVNKPLCARTLVLDTVYKEDQLREDLSMAYFGVVPKFSNQEWYERMGYQLIKTVDNYYKTPDLRGKVWDYKTVFLRKDIA